MQVGSPRGFTLPELLIGLVLLSMLGAILVRTGLAAERSTRLARAAAQLERSFDTALDFLDSELADVGTDPSATDFLRFGADSVTWRATRGLGLACQISAAEVRVLDGQWSGSRLPQAGRDSLLLYAGTDSSRADSVTWIALPVLGVSATNCGGAPALRLQTSLDTTLVPPSRLPALVPVRVFEIMQARLYSSLGSWWFGARSVSAGEAIQPVAGPLAPGGLRFAYFDSVMQPAASAALVRAVSVVVLGSVAGRGDSAGASWAPSNLVP